MRNEPSRVAGFGAAFLRGIIRASRRQAGSPPLPTQESLPLHTGFAVLWQKPAFYGHPTLSTWFTSEYKKSGKKLDMGKGCVRFKSLEDLALDVVGRTVARVSAEEHMANYQAVRALMGNGKSSAKKGARKSAVKKAKPKK